eukprot:1385650-Amorphochlora_amoeboformis.AAC.2
MTKAIFRVPLDPVLIPIFSVEGVYGGGCLRVFGNNERYAIGTRTSIQSKTRLREVHRFGTSATAPRELKRGIRRWRRDCWTSSC